jgi:hypothetical protein
VISTVAGIGEPGFCGDGGPATAATFISVEGISFDGNGNLLIADTTNNRIRRVDQKGIITTVAGAGKTGHSGDAGPATAATFHDPVSVVADADGNLQPWALAICDGTLYITDSRNGRVRTVS